MLLLDAVLMQGRSIGSRNTEGGEAWGSTLGASAVTGRDLRTAEPSMHQPSRRFALSLPVRVRKFYSFTSALCRASTWRSFSTRQEVAVIKEAIHDTGVINGRFTSQETQDLSMTLRSGASCRPASSTWKSARWGCCWAPILFVPGVRAAMLGMLAVHPRSSAVPFDHRWAGVNADIALILNLVIFVGPRALPAGADAAGHCRRHPDGGHGCGFQRPGFLSASGRAEERQDAALSRGAGIRPRLDHHRRYPRHHHHLRRDSSSVPGQ